MGEDWYRNWGEHWEQTQITGDHQKGPLECPEKWAVAGFFMVKLSEVLRNNRVYLIEWAEHRDRLTKKKVIIGGSKQGMCHIKERLQYFFKKISHRNDFGFRSVCHEQNRKIKHVPQDTDPRWWLDCRDKTEFSC